MDDRTERVTDNVINGLRIVSTLEEMAELVERAGKLMDSMSEAMDSMSETMNKSRPFIRCWDCSNYDRNDGLCKMFATRTGDREYCSRGRQRAGK